jgi:uncharacterized membrane protein YeaQ/YmgE (transglycosylase-associated protein family)
MLHFIGFIIMGFIVGLVARAVKPGNDRMGLGLTTLLGIAGALLGGWLGRAFGWYGPEDGAGFIMATLGAVIVLSVYYLATRGHAHTPRI